MNLTIEQARQKGHTKLFFSWGGIGDSIAFLNAVCEYYKYTRQQILIYTKRPEFFENLPFADLLSAPPFFNNENDRGFFNSLLSNGIEPVFCHSSFFRPLAPDLQKNLLLWAPPKHMVTRLCECMGINGPVTISPHLELKKEEIKEGKLSDRQIIIISQGLQNYKSWPLNKTKRLVEESYGKYDFIQVGPLTDPALPHVTDLRGRLTLRQLASYLYHSKLFVGPIGGLMHLARAVNCHALVIASHAEPQSQSFYHGNIFVYPKTSCRLCGRLLRDPQHQPCFFGYNCISNVLPEDVSDALQNFMENKKYREPFPLQTETAKSSGTAGLEGYWKQRSRKSYIYGKKK